MLIMESVRSFLAGVCRDLSVDTREVSRLLLPYQISLLDLDGNAVPSCSMASGTPCKFSGQQGQGGALVERKVLEGSGYLKNDAFSVRCDVTVLNKIFSKAVPVSEVRRRVIKLEI